MMSHIQYKKCDKCGEIILPKEICIKVLEHDYNEGWKKTKQLYTFHIKCWKKIYKNG